MELIVPHFFKGKQNSRTDREEAEQLRDFIRVMPKVHLHLHAEGILPPERVLRFAKKYDVMLPKGLIENDQYTWVNETGFLRFINFLEQYDQASSVLVNAEAIEENIYEFLSASAEEGCVYTELTISPDHLKLSAPHLSYSEVLAAVEKGIQRAKASHGIDARIIIVLVRHLGTDFAKLNNPSFAAERQSMLKAYQDQAVANAGQLVDTVLANPHPYVRGIGLAGAEADFPPALFVEAFKRVKAAGLKITIHAGEWTNADDVRQAIDLLGADRVAHGIHAVRDPGTLTYVKEKDVLLELCPGSNELLNTKSSFPEGYQGDPLEAIHAAEVSYSLSTDDPGLFRRTLCDEHKYAYEHAVAGRKLTRSELLDISMDAMKHSFAEDALKKQIIEGIEDFAKQHEMTFSPERP